jgi:uncharacterized protein with ParB-like and HNH nuclease domain
MHAGETKIQAIIDSTRQYVVPLFQRPYSWESLQWAALWHDLASLCEEDNPRNHFIASIVTMPYVDRLQLRTVQPGRAISS